MVKNRLVRLCNHQDFRADAVTRKKPQRVWRRLGRAFNFDKMEEQESGFIKERADMVESIFVPRWADLLERGRRRSSRGEGVVFISVRLLAVYDMLPPPVPPAKQGGYSNEWRKKGLG